MSLGAWSLTLAAGATLRAVIWTGALIILLIATAVALRVIRRRLLGGDSHTPIEFLPIHELRAMRARGEIDDAEFETLRSASLAQWGAHTSPAPPAMPSTGSERKNSPRTENPTPPETDDEA